jgi:protein AATF/BFR2
MCRVLTLSTSRQTTNAFPLMPLLFAARLLKATFNPSTVHLDNRTISSTMKKRDLSVFQAVEDLELQDSVAATKKLKVRTTDVAKSKAAQSQQRVYDSLLECRILLQRSLQHVTSLKDEGEEETPNAKKETVDMCDTLLSNLLKARQSLMVTFTEQNSDDDDDDIEKITRNKSSLNHKLQTDFNVCQSHWEGVLNRRHKDLRLHSGQTSKSQFRLLDSTFWQQVQSTVQHEESQSKPFDDTKVYQQLLKEFVSSHAQSTAAQTSLTQWRQQQQKQQSQKKPVDRRASKGRKLRYTVLPKLVNFTFPQSRPTSQALDQDAWFKSLLGGAGYKNTAK